MCSQLFTTLLRNIRSNAHSKRLLSSHVDINLRKFQIKSEELKSNLKKYLSKDNETKCNRLEKNYDLHSSDEPNDYWISDIGALSRSRILFARELWKEYKDINDVYDICSECDHELRSECYSKLQEIEIKLRDRIFSDFLNQSNNASDCFIDIVAGAGGIESCDWSSMLSKMYEAWCKIDSYNKNRQVFGFETLYEQSDNESSVGFRHATFKISGKNAYGWCKAEAGVHRLVRISPFDPQHKRHTSFSLVRVYPCISEDSEESVKSEISIKSSDIRIDTYRSSGAGGQHVNTTDSAVRVTHKPTGLVVTCQKERSQHRNRVTALEVLKSKLIQLHLEKTNLVRQESMLGLGESISWGNQIRSYVMQPYQIVKDHRTGWESGSVDRMMRGELLDSAVEAALWKLYLS